LNIVVTGARGFLGRRLIARLLGGQQLSGRAGLESVDRIVAVDQSDADPSIADPRLEQRIGDLSQPSTIESLIDASISSIFHFAAIVSGAAEANFDLGQRINLDATLGLLERCRSVGHVPRFIFTSSVAVFGNLPSGYVVKDDTAAMPATSYGMQKAVGELLVNDYSRKGFIDGRSLRVPTITVRAGKPNAAASSFASGVIREPLTGVATRCPVPLDTMMWLTSPSKAIENLILAQQLSAAEIGYPRTLNLPGLSVSVGEMLRALEQAGGAKARSLVTVEPDEAICSIVASWPSRFEPRRAEKLGFHADTDFSSIVRAYQAEQAQHAG
jgi:nucleoside-diphosphate-sugar epimerase